MSGVGLLMTETKSTTLTVRVHPTVKEGLRIVAEKERRSLANMIEVMIRQYCDEAGVQIAEATPDRPRRVLEAKKAG